MTARAEQLELVAIPDDAAIRIETQEQYIARVLPKLTQLAREFASARADRRVHAGALRDEAKRHGIITGEEKGRKLSFIHQVFPKAGFVRTDATEWSNGNLNRVWYLPLPEDRS